MAGDIFKGISELRMVLDTETDHASPDNETTYSAIRKAIESLFLLLLSTGATGTLTSDPTDDTTGDAIDTGAGFTDDLHNGRTILFTDGLAIGEMFTIDDTVAADNAVYCTGDNLYDAGARSGDEYVILYDILVNTDGHDHDNVNSPSVVLADGQVTQAKLDTNQSTVSVDCPAVATYYTAAIPGGEYGFNAQVYVLDEIDVDFVGFAYENNGPASWSTPKAKFTSADVAGAGAQMAYARVRFVDTSSEVYWYFALTDKDTGILIKDVLTPEHPVFFEDTNDPSEVEHPFDDYDPGKHKIVVSIVDKDIRADAESANENLLIHLHKHYRQDFKSTATWPVEKVTVGLPENKKTGISLRQARLSMSSSRQFLNRIMSNA